MLVFFNADHFKARIRTIVAQAARPVRYVVLDAESIPNMDSTGAAALEETLDELAAEGIGLAIAAAHGPLRDILDRSGPTERIGADRCFASLDSAVARLEQPQVAGTVR